MTGWTTHTLGEVATVGAGNSAPQDEALFVNGSVPFFRTSDVGRIRFGDIDTATDLLNERGAKGLRRFTSGTILFPKSGASTFLNHRVMMQVDGCVSSHLATIDARREFVEPRYLLYFLATVQAQDLVQDHAYPSLNLPLIAGIEVPLPQLPEQRRIVAILDEAFEAIATAKANAEKNLQNARELFEQAVEKVFQDGTTRWRSFPLDAIGKTQTGSTPKSAEPDHYGDALPFIKPGDFRPDGTLDYGNDGLSELGASRARVVPADSALMVCIGATIGKAGFCDRPIATNQQINAWTPNGEASARFIWYQMTTRDFQRRVRENAGQATLPIINKSKWSSLAVVVPPSLEEQISILQGLDALGAQLDSLCEVLARKLAALDELKKSLLHQAFTGQLTAKSTDHQLEAVA